MKTANCVGIGFTDDDVPAFVFNVELHDGRDLDGKFDVAFGVGERDGVNRFVVLTDQKEIVAEVNPEDSHRVATRLADAGEYIICIDYENMSYELPDGVVVPILGRVVGEQFDWVEREQLSVQLQNEVEKVRDVLI